MRFSWCDKSQKFVEVVCIGKCESCICPEMELKILIYQKRQDEIGTGNIKRWWVSGNKAQI